MLLKRERKKSRIKKRVGLKKLKKTVFVNFFEQKKWGCMAPLIHGQSFPMIHHNLNTINGTEKFSILKASKIEEFEVRIFEK